MQKLQPLVGRDGWWSWRGLDRIVAAGLVVAAVGIGIAEHAPAVAVAGLAGSGATVAARRWSPAGSCLMALAGTAVARGISGDGGSLLPVVGATASTLNYYALGAGLRNVGPRSRVAFVGLAVVPLIFLAGWNRNGAVDGLTSWLIFVGLPVLAGWAVATRRALARALIEENVCLEQEQRDRIAWLAGEERVRVARELHDIVAHSVSVMVIQAAAARSAARRNPAAARCALDTVQKCGGDGLQEIGHLVEILRRSDGRVDDVHGQDLQAGLAHVTTLVEGVRAAGLAVHLTVVGDPHPLAPGVDLAAYRVVQEALTNAVKHAGQASASLTITYSEAAVEVEVVDDGCQLISALSSGSGWGLAGMNERVRLYGGAVTAGTRPDGRGFRVWARIPIEIPAGIR